MEVETWKFLRDLQENILVHFIVIYWKIFRENLVARRRFSFQLVNFDFQPNYSQNGDRPFKGERAQQQGHTGGYQVGDIFLAEWM